MEAVSTCTSSNACFAGISARHCKPRTASQKRSRVLAPLHIEQPPSASTQPTYKLRKTVCTTTHHHPNGILHTSHHKQIPTSAYPSQTDTDQHFHLPPKYISPYLFSLQCLPIQPEPLHLLSHPEAVHWNLGILLRSKLVGCLAIEHAPRREKRCRYRDYTLYKHRSTLFPSRIHAQL